MLNKIFFLLLYFICLSSFAEADTLDFLDYWRISYNKNLIRETYIIEVQEISIKIKDIKPTDSLVIEYFRDTPCHKCECYVFIEDKEKRTITKGESTGTGTPIKISLSKILFALWKTPQYHLKSKEQYYKIIYTENNKYWRGGKKILFNLKLE
ncbi:hypothetical protein V9L05_14330 [Bernardetia sp. Wsw4-3y2]|uniref:hypothetical protein n=1 Tax=Bernardetia sp. Wsw4-3y2 TaxID=3127471 RepID=UPI0030D1C51A